MHRYANNNKVSGPRELQRKVVTEVRQVTYLNNNPDPKKEEPLTTMGIETVTEISVSPDFVTGFPKIVGTKTIDNRFEVPKENKWEK